MDKIPADRSFCALAQRMEKHFSSGGKASDAAARDFPPRKLQHELCNILQQRESDALVAAAGAAGDLQYQTALQSARSNHATAFLGASPGIRTLHCHDTQYRVGSAHLLGLPPPGTAPDGTCMPSPMPSRAAVAAAVEKEPPAATTCCATVSRRSSKANHAARSSWTRSQTSPRQGSSASRTPRLQHRMRPGALELRRTRSKTVAISWSATSSRTKLSWSTSLSRIPTEPPNPDAARSVSLPPIKPSRL
ncbi:hypothetical protein DFJ74DRAFT_650603, partial [Hyaloraphidium curvatum]